MSRYSKHLIEKTKQVWQAESGYAISTQEAIEIIANTVALFELIIELDAKYGQA